MNNIPEYSVSEITNLTKNILEENFGLIKVRGEISKVKEFKGHYYFSLKDENYILNSVCWSRNIDFLNIKPEEGLEVFAQGKLTTYAKGSISNYQLQVEQIDAHGEGALLKIFELRKKKLEKEGLFDNKYKKPIPVYPKKIGIITSPSGSVIMDIIDRIKKRYPTHLELFPVTVQGVKAANEIISGINFFNKNSKVDIIIIARGGGGAEDFLAFNDEGVVRKVFDSKIPIISAIGHETDFTLIDFVADIRAATPTAAAEIAVPDIKNLYKELFQQFKRLNFALNTFLSRIIKNLSNIKKLLNYKTLYNSLNHNKKDLEILKKNLNNYILNIKKNKMLKFENSNSRLENLSIKNVLKRGYSIVREHNKKNIIKTHKIASGKLIDIELFDGIVTANITLKNE